MYVVIVGSCCLDVCIVLTSFKLTMCEWSYMQLNPGALPEGEDSVVEQFHCAWARWSPSGPKLPLMGFTCVSQFCRTGPLGFFHLPLTYGNTKYSSSSICQSASDDFILWRVMHRANNGFLPSVLGWEKIIPDANPHWHDIQCTMPSFSSTSFVLLPFHLVLKMEKLTDSLVQ